MRIVCFLVYVLCFVAAVKGRLSPSTCDFPRSCDHRIKALLAIVEALGYSPFFETWKGTDPCQSWYGINCIEGRITSVSFISMNLTGIISPSFADLTSLVVIDVSHNHLTGIVPFELTILNLKTLDVSYNNLHGKVPQFRTTIPDIQGNPKIETDIIHIPSGSSNKKESTILRVIVVVTSLFFIGGVCVTLWYCMKMKKSDSLPEPNETMALPDAQQPREDDESSIPMQILREATDDFDSNNMIGRGGFGSVYRGKLQDGTEIAVKKMDQSLIVGRGLDQFRAEVSVLTKVHHRNLVVLQGHCIEGSERLLVYRYMPQGSLSRHLFHWKDQGLKPLEWSRRLIVALDVARGVEYLHTLARENQSYIHRDLKPENILLGDDMRAKVSDFGLVRSTEVGRESIKTKNVGTYGYMAPEYALRGTATRKIDVYSFGVVLMELLTGQQAIDEKRYGYDALLAVWFQKIFAEKDSFPKIIDEAIEVNEETQGSISQVAELACYCCAQIPEQRPDMSRVVTAVSSLVEHWTPSEVEEDNAMDSAAPEWLRNYKLESGSVSI